jgi:hypothetical protein
MSKDELIVRLVSENIELREENEKLRENSVPVTRNYSVGDLAAILKDVAKNNEEESVK